MDLLDTDPCDDHASGGVEGHKVLSLKTAKRLTHRCATHAKLFCEIDFTHAFTGRERPVANGFA
ncbi:hypothetical protein SAMN05192563_105711 [Paraburkholderia aspalathi]|uniref:Uncharacterized protein n=1 Tax=Paraburkholderia aspalathi TaxID=1324617 RepID=A0A1I7ERG5_9BURK|nr:hypothetical protein SAMN05192563_105711 [Paraburkholderia aspalathi]